MPVTIHGITSFMVLEIAWVTLFFSSSLQLVEPSPLVLRRGGIPRRESHKWIIAPGSSLQIRASNSPCHTEVGLYIGHTQGQQTASSADIPPPLQHDRAWLPLVFEARIPTLD
ncbi:hypothetical protein E3N88_04198 [Mikania micrantha]|uniref:Uncharacterized protein n=1 Tax=Mikania micrantha TaxID=192012 RepID=A0A5N6PWK1_9ASTR|nr:hypothetical protein E3N88_04198 [Mikania micrantha]